jgi:tetratricopeptide (TPR) repeat protein
MPLKPDDQRYLTAAEGYVALSMWQDANAELEEINPEYRHLPEVLEVRLKIYRALEKWELMQTVARKLTQYDPDYGQWILSLAYATRRAESIEAAKMILLEAVERMPKAAVFQYNLACYECQLGEVEVANSRLKHAFKLDPTLRLTALDDPDLEAIWDQLN